MGLADRPDGTLPQTPLLAKNQAGGWTGLQADQGGNLYVVPNTPQTCDQQGHVIWSDDFEENLNHWEVTLVESGTTAALSTSSAHKGNKSCQIVTDAVEGAGAALGKYFPDLRAGRVGIELRAALLAGDSNFGIWVDFYTGAKKYRFGLKYSAAGTHAVSLSNAAGGAYTDILTGELLENISAFHSMKLVLDLTLHKYVRAIVNGKSYDVSAFTPDVENDTSPKAIMVVLFAAASAAAAKTFYLDQAIVTDQEPENTGAETVITPGGTPPVV